MIRVPPGSVLLDPADVNYVGRALEHLAQLMAERRDEHGNRAPSQPSPKLATLTAKLRRTVGSAASLAVDDLADDDGRPAEAPEDRQCVRAPQQDSVNAMPHDIGTGEAAQRLGITPNAVRDLARRGRLTATRTGTRWRYNAATVDVLAEQKAASKLRR